VILPIGALPEIDATLTNLEGLDQGTLAGGKLPGEARAGWRVLRALGGELAAQGLDFTDLAGLRASIHRQDVRPIAGGAPSVAGEGLELAVSAAIYRSDAVVRRAANLQSHPLNVEPHAVMHPTDAEALGFREGVVGKFTAAAGTATLPIALSDKVARGTVWIESGHGATAPLGAGRVQAGRA
jgi:NADH-quinone oxidoreductase subunit G